MRINKSIKEYIIFSGSTILEALNKINANKSRIVFVLQDNGVLLGSVSDGDIRRWITSNNNLNLDEFIDKVMNEKVVSRPISDSILNIKKSYENKFDIIPLVDDQGRFVAVAKRDGRDFQIRDFSIGKDKPTFIIAEVGNNHNGDIDLAKKLVDLSVYANADCVKFQMRDLTSLYVDEENSSFDLGTQYTLDLLKKFQLTDDELFEVFDYANSKNIIPLCTPWDLRSFQKLENYGLEGYKVASADFTNFEMLEALCETGKPLICSTGMSTENEIRSSVNFLKNKCGQYALLHCNSTYPTPFKDVNLNYLPRLEELADSVIGYSGHERGFAVPLGAVSMGARIIEKHFTVDRGMEGNDHKVSLLPEEFKQMVFMIRNLEESFGNKEEREITQGELINRENLAKSLIINRDLDKGIKIERSMIEVKSPGQGLQPNRIDELVGKISNRIFKKGDVFFESDITAINLKKNGYEFKRPFGIPVRFHDFDKLVKNTNLDFVEFHLSYSDLNENLDDFFKTNSELDYAVHSPELFSEDHILDLASENKDYLERSINELQKTIDKTREINKYFPNSSPLGPVLVLNAGGWSTKGFLGEKQKQLKYKLVAESLAKVNKDDVRIAIQTMPPFPWHFGGQSYHNLFIEPDEIVQFCELHDYKICLDVSHSMMACNYLKIDFNNFLRKVLPYTIHLHIVDAKGVDAEGVQIGKGDVNFNELKRNLEIYADGVQFIPEIWQGHKNQGEGFWLALEFLEKSGF